MSEFWGPCHTVVWTTDHPATSRVIYDTVSHAVLGAAPNYGYANSTVEDAVLVTGHSVSVPGLTAGTTYFFRTVSHGSPEAVGDEFTGTTASASAPAASPVVRDDGGILIQGVAQPAPQPQGIVLGVAVFRFTNMLHVGSRGDDVTELQKRLTEEGVYSGPITGYFGSLTFAAVKAYQAKNGIQAIGIVGPKTLASLNNILVQASAAGQVLGVQTSAEAQAKIKELQAKIAELQAKLGELLKQKNQ